MTSPPCNSVEALASGEDRGRSLWRVATEQVGIGFVHLDELSEIIDAEACEGRYRLVTGAKDGEAAVLRGKPTLSTAS